MGNEFSYLDFKGPQGKAKAGVEGRGVIWLLTAGVRKQQEAET